MIKRDIIADLYVVKLAHQDNMTTVEEGITPRTRKVCKVSGYPSRAAS